MNYKWLKLGLQWPIHHINGVLLVLITGVSGHDCGLFISRRKWITLALDLPCWCLQIASGNQTWLAGKWTIEMSGFPSYKPQVTVDFPASHVWLPEGKSLCLYNLSLPRYLGSAIHKIRITTRLVVVSFGHWLVNSSVINQMWARPQTL